MSPAGVVMVFASLRSAPALEKHRDVCVAWASNAENVPLNGAISIVTPRPSGECGHSADLSCFMTGNGHCPTKSETFFRTNPVLRLKRAANQYKSVTNLY